RKIGRAGVPAEHGHGRAVPGPDGDGGQRRGDLVGGRVGGHGGDRNGARGAALTVADRIGDGRGEAGGRVVGADPEPFLVDDGDVHALRVRGGVGDAEQPALRVRVVGEYVDEGRLLAGQHRDV